MKKFILTTVVSLLFLSVFAICSLAADSQAVYATKPPAIDGEIDPIWETAPKQEGTFTGDGDWDNEVYATGYTKILWDEEFIYLLGVVTDSTIPASADATGPNSVDFWLSEENTKESDYNSSKGDWHYCINSQGKTFYYIGNEDVYKKGASAAKLTKDGYVVEVKVPFMSGIKPAVGHIIGYNVSINDDADDDNVRDAWISWLDYNGNPYWENTEALSEVELVAAPVVDTPEEEPVEPNKNPVTSDINILFYLTAISSMCGICITKKK